MTILTDEDWELIAGLWIERDRLLSQLDHLLTLKRTVSEELGDLRRHRRQLMSRKAELTESIGAMRRDIEALSDKNIAEKFEVTTEAFKVHPGHRVV